MQIDRKHESNAIKIKDLEEEIYEFEEKYINQNEKIKEHGF